MILEFAAERYHEARAARNYLIHHSMLFVEAIGDPSCESLLLNDVESELRKIKQAVATVLEAEDDMNTQDFYFNFKDGCPALWTKDYVSHMLKWVFDAP